LVRETFADFRLELVEDSTDRLLDGLKSGYYSMVVGRSSPQDDFSVLHQIPLYPETGAIVARPGHPAFGRVYGELASLCAYPWVLPQPGPTRSAIELSFMRARCNPPTPSFINYSIHIVCDLLARSDALSVLPLGPAKPFLKAGTIVEISARAEFHLPSYAIYRPLHAAGDPVLSHLESSILRIASSLDET
jgi:DNA-binding transcriptional LysR family regulator